MSYRIHKWIGIAVGVFLVIWLISGIVMVLPDPFSMPVHEAAPASLNLQQVSVTLAEASEGLTESVGRPLRIKSLALLRIRDVVVYKIDTEDGGSKLIDGKSGRLFEITPKLAEEIVRDAFPTAASVFRVERITQHDLSYAWGLLPAYRILFDDSRATHYHVSIREGTIQRSNRWSRLLTTIEGLHTFKPLKLVIKEDAVRRGLLVLVSLVGIAVAVTGYYLAVSRWLP